MDRRLRGCGRLGPGPRTRSPPRRRRDGYCTRSGGKERVFPARPRPPAADPIGAPRPAKAVDGPPLLCHAATDSARAGTARPLPPQWSTRHADRRSQGNQDRGKQGEHDPVRGRDPGPDGPPGDDRTGGRAGQRLRRRPVPGGRGGDRGHAGDHLRPGRAGAARQGAAAAGIPPHPPRADPVHLLPFRRLRVPDPGHAGQRGSVHRLRDGHRPPGRPAPAHPDERGRRPHGRPGGGPLPRTHPGGPGRAARRRARGRTGGGPGARRRHGRHRGGAHRQRPRRQCLPARPEPAPAAPPGRDPAEELHPADVLAGRHP